MAHARRSPAVSRPTAPVRPAGDPAAVSKSARRLKKVKLLLIGLVCFALSLAVVAQYSSLVILNYRLSSTRAELSALKESVRAMELEAAQLGAISRIEALARGELGMMEPESGQLKIISASQKESSRPGE